MSSDLTSPTSELGMTLDELAAGTIQEWSSVIKSWYEEDSKALGFGKFEKGVPGGCELKDRLNAVYLCSNLGLHVNLTALC